MACSKHGSRSVDALWSKASHKGREWIAGELCSNESLLQANQFGKFIHQNLALGTFKRSREEWRQVLDAKTKKSQLAKEFLSALDLKRPLPSGDKKAKRRADKSSIGIAGCSHSVQTCGEDPGSYSGLR